MNGFCCFTDGGAIVDQRIGGWAFLIVEDGNVVYSDSGSDVDTTSQRMELKAAIMALEFLPEEAEMPLFSDSQYVIKGITEWRHGWKKNGWSNSKDKIVSNYDLWRRLDRLAEDHPKMTFKWIRGHIGNPYNGATDNLVKDAMRNHICSQT